jgi:hypothetical protein
MIKLKVRNNIFVIGCLTAILFLGFTYRHSDSVTEYHQPSPLEEQRKYSKYFCTDVHPVTITGVSNYYKMVNGKNLSLALFDKNDIVSNFITKGRGWEMEEIDGILKVFREFNSCRNWTKHAHLD